MTSGSNTHEWIGIKYSVASPGVAKMELPSKFLEELILQIGPYCEVGRSTLRDAERMVGRACRVSQVVPTARPFVSALWAALTGTRKDAQSGANKTRGQVIATRRFITAARWMRALLRGEDSALLPLQRLVRPRGPAPASSSAWAIQFDASTTGGGAVLRCNKVVTEYFEVKWEATTAVWLGVETHNSKFQTFWEFLTLVLALCVWGDQFVQEAVALLGDNTGALQDALHLKGRGILAAVARELSWRKARYGWEVEVGHVPGELNTVPDALSRLHEKVPPKFPKSLRGCLRREPPDLDNCWKVR